MTRLALPVYRISCRVGIDKGRAWSVVEEVILLAVSREQLTMAALVERTALPRQIVVASIARLMRFRLVEVALGEEVAAFRASALGARLVREGIAMPYYPKRFARRLSFLLDRATGSVCSNRGVDLMSESRLEAAESSGEDIRRVVVMGGAPSISHAANFSRLCEIASRAWDEQLAEIYGRTTSVRGDEYLVVSVLGGDVRGLPGDAPNRLRDVLVSIANASPGNSPIEVQYIGPREEQRAAGVRCDLGADDLVVGGPAHRALFEKALKEAHRRLIVHSTFLRRDAFSGLLPALSAACREGLTVDVLWGAEADDDQENQSSVAAAEIMSLVRADPNALGRIRVRMRSTGSHAKMMMYDTRSGDWVGVVGSCNWFSSPFESVEVSVVLRDQLAAAQVARSLQELSGRSGLSDDIAGEMAIVARRLSEQRESEGRARVVVIAGAEHDSTMREASGAAQRRLVIASHRLGSIARPGAIMPAEVAASRGNVVATVLYTRTSGGLRSRDAKAIANEARENGVNVVKTSIPVHGKILAWDDDDLVVTSLNWASAATDGTAADEIGVHITSPGIVGSLLGQLNALVPGLQEAMPPG